MTWIRKRVGVAMATFGILIGGLLLFTNPALALYVPSGQPAFGSVPVMNGLAIDEANGVVYAAGEAGTVYKFNKEGTPENFLSLSSPELTVPTPGDRPSGYPIAVDHSANGSDPSKGDLYVTDYKEGVVYKYNEKGEKEAGTIENELEGTAVAVNSEGDVFVGEFLEKKVFEYSSTGTLLNGGNPVLAVEGLPNAMAFNSHGDLYVAEVGLGTFEFKPNGSGEFVPVSEPNPPLGSNPGGLPGFGVTVDESTNDVFVDNYGNIQEFGEAGGTTPLSKQFGPRALQESNAVAINETTKTVYAANRLTEKIETYKPVAAKTLKVVKSVTGTGVGTVTSEEPGIDCGEACAEESNEFPEGGEVTLTAKGANGSRFVKWTGCTSTSSGPNGEECKIEALTANKEVTVEFELIPKFILTISDVGAGKGTVTGENIECGIICAAEVEEGKKVTLTEAPEPGSKFVGWTGCTSTGETTCEVEVKSATEVKAEFSQEPPTVVTGAASGVTSSAASVAGTVNPNGAEVTECKFEFGTTTAYGSVATCASNPGAGASAVAVKAALSGLTSNATYHYRLVAKNVGGVTKGGDKEFKTPKSAEEIKHEEEVKKHEEEVKQEEVKKHEEEVKKQEEEKKHAEEAKAKAEAEAKAKAEAEAKAKAEAEAKAKAEAEAKKKKEEEEAKSKGKLTRAQQLAKALKQCKKQPKKKRAKCVATAKKKYGPKSKKKK